MHRLNNNGFGLIPVLLIILIMIVAGFSGYYVYKQNNNTNSSQNSATSQNNTQKDSEKNKLDDTEANKNTEATKAVNTVSAKPIVTFQPAGLFTDQEKSELNSRLIEPMTDYYPGQIAVIIIEVNTPQKFVNGNSDDKYLVEAIFSAEKSEGFLYGSKKNGIDWWAPSCFSTCEFTTEYKQKYPEVVKKAQ